MDESLSELCSLLRRFMDRLPVLIVEDPEYVEAVCQLVAKCHIIGLTNANSRLREELANLRELNYTLNVQLDKLQHDH